MLKYPNNQSADNYDLMRKFAIILLKDIVYDKKSIVRDEFANLLNVDIENQIRKIFSERKEKLDDDINMSVDQTETLEEAIRNGLEYPELEYSENFEKPFINHEKLMVFLNCLCNIFKWEKYEFGTLGKLSKTCLCLDKSKCDCPKTERRTLRLYAVILSMWIQGYGVKYIIEQTMRYMKEKDSTISSYGKNIKFDFYDKEHKNIVIGDVLDIIENIILFRISNYFLKFSTEYKKVHGKFPDNDWYEYVEYGTTDELSIFLQRNGFERDTANYIKNNRYYIRDNKSGEYRILNSIMNCGKESVIKDITDNRPNVTELFVDSNCCKKWQKLLYKNHKIFKPPNSKTPKPNLPYFTTQNHHFLPQLL